MFIDYVKKSGTSLGNWRKVGQVQKLKDVGNQIIRQQIKHFYLTTIYGKIKQFLFLKEWGFCKKF
jgi:hypothetical protein